MEYAYHISLWKRRKLKFLQLSLCRKGQYTFSFFISSGTVSIIRCAKGNAAEMVGEVISCLISFFFSFAFSNKTNSFVNP